MSEVLVIIHGGGEMGSAVGHALHKAGCAVLILDRALPSALRLRVAFAAAVVARSGRVVVQGVEAIHVKTPAEIAPALEAGTVAVYTGGLTELAELALEPAVVVDARMRQLTEPVQRTMEGGPVVLGIGPGFEVGRDCHYLLESNRGPGLGSVITEGGAEAHTGVPGEVQGLREERILRAPCAGRVERACELGAFVEAREVVATVGGAPVVAGLAGMVRGLKLTGVEVAAGNKIGDVDPRRDRALLGQLTDKAEALGRGALAALALAGISPQNHSNDRSDRSGLAH